MKSRILFIAITLFMALASPAQNLVPNYSFENITQCTTNCTDFIGFVSDWTGQQENGGLFYYTAQCSSDTGTGSGAYNLSGSVPYNYYLGFQYAHTGVSYAGIGTFVIGNPSDTMYPYGNTNFANARNYLEAPLTSSLIAGAKYYVTFFVNLQNSSDFSCSDIGAYFSDSALVFNNSTSGTSIGKVKSYLVPQVANDPKKQELSDTLNWIKISGSFTAKGGEKYIVIGNFKNDSLSSIRYIDYSGGSSGDAYYYIDDVIVSTDSNYADSLESVNELKVESENVKVYPNPSKGVFTFNLNKNTEKSILTIYNMLGESIYTSEFNTATTQVDLSGQSQGVYLYRIITEQGGIIGTGKLIIQ